MKKITVSLSILITLLFTNCAYDNELEQLECPPSVSFDLLSVENTKCGASLGLIEIEANVDPTLGVGASEIQYSINGRDFASNGLFENLSASNYIVTARLREGCQFTQSVTVENEAGLQISTDVTDDDCANPGNGSVTVSTTNASGTVTFNLDGVTNTDGVFSNIREGVYQLIAEDAAGCQVSQEVEVKGTVAPETVYSIIETTCATANCHGGSQGPDLTTNQRIEDRKARIFARTSNKTMPPAGSGASLTDEEIDLIRCWAEQ